MNERLIKFISDKVYVFTVLCILALLKTPFEYFKYIVWTAAAFFAVRAFQYWLWEKKK